MQSFKVAGYIRLSKEDKIKNESNSVTNQKLIITSYIEKNKALSVKLGAEQQITDERTTVWTDGVYQGTGQGFGGTISVEVVIKEGKIEDITILSAKQEDKAYLDSAIAVIEKMKEEQRVDVDVVSQATYSSNGIKDAVKNALEVEENNEE